VLAVTGMTLATITSERQKAEQLVRGQAQALVKSIAFLTAAPDLDRFLEHVLRVMVEELRGSGGVLWLPDHEAEVLRLHLEYVEGHILTAADTVYPAGKQLIPLEESPVPLDPDSWGKTRFYSEGDPRISNEMWQYLSHVGARGLLSVPMVLGRETIGWITVRARQSQIPDLASTIGIAEALARQATLAIQMAKLGEQARDSAVLAERIRIARAEGRLP
jgi:GAF domain-containing protein